MLLLLLLLLLFNSMPHRKTKTMERIGQNETFWNRYLIGVVRAVCPAVQDHEHTVGSWEKH